MHLTARYVKLNSLHGQCKLDPVDCKFAVASVIFRSECSLVAGGASWPQSARCSMELRCPCCSLCACTRNEPSKPGHFSCANQHRYHLELGKHQYNFMLLVACLRKYFRYGRCTRGVGVLLGNKINVSCVCRRCIYIHDVGHNFLVALEVVAICVAHNVQCAYTQIYENLFIPSVALILSEAQRCRCVVLCKVKVR